MPTVTAADGESLLTLTISSDGTHLYILMVHNVRVLAMPYKIANQTDFCLIQTNIIIIIQEKATDNNYTMVQVNTFINTCHCGHTDDQ